MNAMPFIEQLRHWAHTRADHDAVIVGEKHLSYADLGPGMGEANTPRFALIEEENGADLAQAFCAGVADHGIVGVLDAHWPGRVRDSVRAASHDWARNSLGSPSSSDVFLLGFSSGTSGMPKGFVRSRSSWANSLLASMAYFSLSPDDVTLAPGPGAASMNLYALAECLASGSTFIGLEHFSARAGLSAIDKHQATRLVLVPSVLGLFADAAGRVGHQALGIRSIVCAGSALSPQTLAAAHQWAPNASIEQYYGAAELGFVAANVLAPALPGQILVHGATEVQSESEDAGVGLPFDGVEVAILDAAGEQLPCGQPGSIFVRSPYVCDAYAWGDDALAFTRVPAGNGESDWCTVRDQGFLDADGRLHVLGRESDMVLVAGNNVYPQEIESVLEDGAQVGSVIATGTKDDRRGQKLVVGLDAQDPRFASALSSGEVPQTLRILATSLPSTHRPAMYFALTELPYTDSGKLSRALLAAWIEDGDGRAVQLR